jgi:hypothetical protein
MSADKNINRWHEVITPRNKAPLPWTIKSGGSWDMLEVQPISDEMLSELARRYYSAGAPWNCRSTPLSDSDREYMFMLYYAFQGMVARLRVAEAELALRPAVVSEGQAIPTGVYWYGPSDNFYDASSGQGMGVEFYQTWVGRAKEFPASNVAALARPAVVSEGQAVACWSCKRPYTAQQRTDADGNCPHCGVEIELDLDDNDDADTRCDPAGDVASNVFLRDQCAGLQVMYRKASDALTEIRGCFDAAGYEGLDEVLAETTDERLKDLVQRRLMYARDYANSVAATPATEQAPTKESGEGAGS